ncbi:aminodeoxychorismate synthase component I [Blautia sp. HCP28S3_G10]|uniref:aminodeoxychorismate synthase component I n=1 Tax=Blautia sp. HCP28S3_G10 TaxID=3438908 RepID=UPI003F8BF8BB
MYEKQRVIKELEEYISAADIFQILKKEKDLAFLDSSLVNQLGRYSVIGRKPYLKLVKDGGKFYINNIEETDITFEDYLRKYLRKNEDKNTTELPLISGAVGYFSYEYGRKLMQVTSSEKDIVSIPDAVLVFYDLFVIEDCQEKKTYLVANGITEDAGELIKKTEQKIKEKKTSGEISETEKKAYNIEVFPNFKKEEYKQAVDEMIHYIIEGDIYIANMTQQMTVKSQKKPEDVFWDLRKNNPSPFGGYLDYDDFQIVCASPERFLKMKKGHVETRPIKGTRKRGETPEEDMIMRKELETSEKDKSELLMIVDLERNDLNRVCKPGSVKVTELFTVEEYATVFHLVSNIEGELEDGRNFADLLEAAFPGGSITGAPKYRAMEIIDELEHGRRNLYTGSIGYLTLGGDCDFNIVIRTALYKDGAYHLGVGGGITAESELEFEYEETLQKAKAVLEAMK